ncbi:MAG TPA: type III-B CRISPR module RAMP protein Cmr6 [Thiolinea sp.]|nr:type III-B CRISPR module RAMP protein Cmr6 [Thiolinea sp.]
MNPAVPDYFDKHSHHAFSNAPPGHRFGLFFPIWNNQTWEMEGRCKTDAVKKVLGLPVESRHQIEALRARQFALVSLAPESTRLTLEAQSISPLATGLGIEHPLENGFAFLNPYGLPYLPGSSVKGVLRRAAEELYGAEEARWTDTAIDALFGKEVEAGDTTTQHTRGALTFWDVIPELTTLGMDVMTPHYGDYYQAKKTDAQNRVIYPDGATPHDAGSPIPIVFMVIPPQSRFSFHITADSSRLQDCNNWQALMQAAFEHAFKWLGFGAKTAVGYGAMQREKHLEEANTQRLSDLIKEAEKNRIEQEQQAALQAELAKMDPIEREIAGFSSITEAVTALESGKWVGDEQKQAAQYLKQRMQEASSKNDKWKEETEAKNPERDKAHRRTLLVMKYL